MPQQDFIPGWSLVNNLLCQVVCYFQDWAKIPVFFNGFEASLPRNVARIFYADIPLGQLVKRNAIILQVIKSGKRIQDKKEINKQIIAFQNCSLMLVSDWIYCHEENTENSSDEIHFNLITLAMVSF